jgi:hypothetical protein
MHETSIDCCTVHLRAHTTFTRVFLRNSLQWKFCFLVKLSSFWIARHFHSSIYTLFLSSENSYSLFYCLTETVHEITMLHGRARARVCVYASFGIWAHVCCLRIKIRYEKKIGYMNNSVTLLLKVTSPCRVWKVWRPRLMERFTATCVLFKFEIYICVCVCVCTIFMRFKTLGEPPVPSLCGLFKMDLTDVLFFLYLLWQRSIACV